MMKVKELIGLLHGLEDFDLKDCAITTEILDAFEAKPVVRGEWRLYSPFTDTYECSNCGYQVIDESFCTNFCPDCGAKMEVRNG